MIYTIEKAELISEQLRKFTTGYPHHVAGHFANIEFWLNEVVSSLNTLDGYNSRFNTLKTHQKDWVKSHTTRVFGFCLICLGKCEFDSGRPSDPVRTSSSELNEARKELVNAAYYFLVRCYRQGLLEDQELKEKCNFIGTGIDPIDLR